MYTREYILWLNEDIRIKLTSIQLSSRFLGGAMAAAAGDGCTGIPFLISRGVDSKG